MTSRVVFTLLVMMIDPEVLSAQFAVSQLTAKDPVVRQSARRRLAAMPSSERERQIPEMVSFLRSSHQFNAGVLGLVKIGPPAVPTLRSLLADPSRVRGSAAQALAMIRPVAQQDIESLRSMLKDDDQWVRQRVAESLLSAGVRDKEAEVIVQQEFASGRGSFGTQAPGGISDWIASLAADDLRTTFNALFSLVKLGEPAVPSLVKALRNPNSDIRAGAAEALRDIHIYRSDVEEAFIKAMNDLSQRVLSAARFALEFTVSEAAKDALLQDEIAEIQRRGVAEQSARNNRARPHTMAEVVARIPPDPDHTHALDVANQFEAKAPDGTVALTVLHSGLQRSDLLRIWTRRKSSYFLAWEDAADEPHGTTPHLSADQFRYQGKTYIHAVRLSEGTGYQHVDQYFRVERGGLQVLKTPRGLPIQLAAKEGVWKGFRLDLSDDDLGFQFWIWNEGDANCCPTAGTVKGTYTIVGDELR